MEGNNSRRQKGKFFSKRPKRKYTQTIRTGAVQKNSITRSHHDAAIEAVETGDESSTQLHLEETPPAASITSTAALRKKTKADLTRELRCTITEQDAALEVVDAAIKSAEAAELEAAVLRRKNLELVETVQVARQAKRDSNARARKVEKEVATMTVKLEQFQASQEEAVGILVKAEAEKMKVRQRFATLFRCAKMNEILLDATCHS
jgi:hypothetical protein